MHKEELIKLREQILSDIVPLVIDSADNGPDRFALLLRLIQAGNASGTVYKRAYESAKQIENTEDRLEALLGLIDEIDFDANSEPAVTVDTQSDGTPDQPESQNDTQPDQYQQ